LSEKSELRLAELVNHRGNLSKAGAESLVQAVVAAKAEAKNLGCDELLAFATSAVRDANNSASVLERVRDKTGVDLNVLGGEDEARLTFLAVRRWYGWSAGALLCLDIGGGSLELSAGPDEDPTLAFSVPLGAGRLTNQWFHSDPPPRQELAALREHVDEVLTEPVRQLLKAGPYDRVVATSKTFRTLARLAGAAPSADGPRVQRVLTRTGLTQVTAFISRMASTDLAELDGVSPGRAHQVLAGAVVAAAAMDALNVDRFELCPWALREGVILRRLDWIEGT
jgi:exopolyphosphatase / guanosine-5'-triphosphate,3'-diphosphate pyrophosphatase